MPKNSYIPYQMNKIFFPPLYPQIQWMPSVSRMILCIQYIAHMYENEYCCEDALTSLLMFRYKQTWLCTSEEEMDTYRYVIQENSMLWHARRDSFVLILDVFVFFCLDGWMSVPHNNATCLTGLALLLGYIQPLRLATFYSLDVGINVNEYPTKNEKKMLFRSSLCLPQRTACFSSCCYFCFCLFVQVAIMNTWSCLVSRYNELPTSA